MLERERVREIQEEIEREKEFETKLIKTNVLLFINEFYRHCYYKITLQRIIL